MRIVINIDPIREGGKRMRVRTRYQLGRKDGVQGDAAHPNVANALVDFYGQISQYIQEAHDPSVTDFVDEGERI